MKQISFGQFSKSQIRTKLQGKNYIFHKNKFASKVQIKEHYICRTNTSKQKGKFMFST